MNIYIYNNNRRNTAENIDILASIAEKYKYSINVYEYSNKDEFVFDLSSHPERADIIFLRISKSKDEQITGLEAAKSLRKLCCHALLIYVSANKQLAADTFPTFPFYYFYTKHLTFEEFENIYVKALSLAQRRRNRLFQCGSDADEHIIPLTDIYYFEIFQRITTVYHNNTSFSFYKSMSCLEKELTPKGFLRIHRSYLINLRHIDQITDHSVRLTNGFVLPIGTTYLSQVRKTLTQLKIYSI
ncbi:LytR/AlgR family response regulator transcription factor [Anaerostipes sp.]|uniref:LytR/AlgR family response regulator transcription factor n=1 Tax=Anaerostipes sp. TaxID=1872530 RepID=UPI0025BEE1D0|nr:LytTR family DNA-binding domain-containing protein [Anaerostipes sp.]MBS7008329.1 response regulator transcription factor [Anaerostipes sp.]